MKKNNRNEKKRIVFINQATGFITIDIVNSFVSEFYEVAVIYGDIRVQDAELNPEVRISKVVEKSRTSNLKRFNRWVIASFQIFFLLISKYRTYEIFYFSVPPFAYLSSLLIRRRFTVLMWDVYPDALVMAGISKNNLIYRVWAAANRYLFRRAYKIYTIGDVLKHQISNYISPEKITVIPLWAGITDCKPVEKDKNPFITEHGLNGKFVVQYSGNIGAGHNIESLIEAAKHTLSDENIVYLITGRGSKFDTVKDLIGRYNLVNCRTLPFQPDNMIRYSLAAADLSVVLIDDNIAQVSIPSKVYNLMAVGSPIISITPEASEINRMIKFYGNGRNFEKDDIEELASFITEMKNSREKLLHFSERSLAASKEFTPSNARRFYETYISAEN